ncbi:hypothetical protein [Rhizobium rhizogenes]|uniref:hypothetical protein n=1 Tax=Rhizobium rhizogenes TaxID=359 RepID=UPI0015721968|nr:hypothetical protein [Rhizobium rhizogenes]
MQGIATIFDNPIVMMVVVGLAVGLAGGILGCFFTPIGRLTPASVFLASYYSAYGTIPDFPPIASTGKVFYSVIGLAAFGLLFDYGLKKRPVAAASAAIAPALLIAWIGYNRLTTAFSVELAVITVLFTIVGAFAVLWVRAIDSAPADASRGPVASISILLSLAVGYAPIALVGGSSTGLGLFAGFAAGLGGLGLVQFIFPSVSLGWTGILSGLGAVLAFNDSVTLINGKMDFVLLILLCLSLILGQLVGLTLPRKQTGVPRLSQIVIGISTLIPSIAVVCLAYLRHADAFHP